MSMTSGNNSKSALHELLSEWTKKVSGSWLDAKNYFAQRRRLLANPDLIASSQFPEQKDIPPLKFATQGVILVAAVSALIGWCDKIVFRGAEQSTVVEENKDSAARLANIESNLHFFLDVGPPPNDEEIDGIASSILHAPADEGLQLDELQAALEIQKRTLQGLPTPARKNRAARIEALKHARDTRIQTVKAQHQIEPDIGLPGHEFVQLQEFVDKQLDTLEYDEASDKVVNMSDVVQRLIDEPKLTSTWLTSFVETEQMDVDRQLQIELARASIAIKVLNRTIALYKKENKQAQVSQQRWREITEHVSPVIQALAVIFSAFLFRFLITVGKHRPSMNTEKASAAYLYLFTGGVLWLNLCYAIGIIAFVDLWKHGPPGSKWRLILSLAGILAYMAWSVQTLYGISKKLENFFGMGPPKHIWELYCGRRKVAFDLILANVVGTAVVFGAGGLVAIAYLRIANGLRL